MLSIKLAAAVMLLAVFVVLPVQTAAMPQSMNCHEMTMAASDTMTHSNKIERADCDHAPGQPCPNDMDCTGDCASLCAAITALIPTPVTGVRASRMALLLPHNTRAIAHQTRLSAPPPRS